MGFRLMRLSTTNLFFSIHQYPIQFQIPLFWIFAEFLVKLDCPREYAIGWAHIVFTVFLL